LLVLDLYDRNELLLRHSLHMLLLHALSGDLLHRVSCGGGLHPRGAAWHETVGLRCGRRGHDKRAL
jgi:hypothetical protein